MDETMTEKLQTIAENVPKVYNKGFEDGKAEGGNTEEAYNKGVEDGKQAEYDLFWDNFQNYGNRDFYSNAFMGVSTNTVGCWNDENFKPKYDFVFSNSNPNATDSMFQYTAIEDLKGCLERSGVKLDFSKALRLTGVFDRSKVTTIPPIDCSNCTSMIMTFYNAKMQELELNNLSETCSFDRAFAFLYNLTTLRVTGTIGKSIDFSTSPLTPDSMKSVISCLKNYLGTSNEYSYTVSFASDRWNKLEADSTAPNGGTWKDYVVYTLGWNI